MLVVVVVLTIELLLEQLPEAEDWVVVGMVVGQIAPP
jgi:hypothetical protein